jgi:prolyl oligopeptidase
MSLLSIPLPVTPLEPVTEFLHGTAVTDPYRWLEDQNSPHTRHWLEEQTAYTRAYLDAIPGRDRIRKRVEELLAVEVVSQPWKVGNRYFYLKRKPYQEQPVIAMCEEDSKEEVVLVDPALRNEDTLTAINIAHVSRDGRLLAYGVRHDGQAFQSVEFIDVHRKEVLPDCLPSAYGPWLEFAPDASGYYYARDRAAFWHRFGNKANEDIETFAADADSRFHLELFGSGDGRFLAYCVIDLGGDPPRLDLYLQDLIHAGSPRRVLEGIGRLFEPTFVGNKIVALTDWKAANRRIVALNLDSLFRDDWHEIVPESTNRIDDYAVIDQFICICRPEGISSRIAVFDLNGHPRGEVPSPTPGTARVFRRPIASDTLFYEFSSFNCPPTIFSYQPGNREHRVWSRPRVQFSASMMRGEQVDYKSKDGTRIPLFLVSRNGRRSSNPLPTFLTAYGGFGTSRTPRFNVYSTILIETGFLFSVANIRGGGEFGEEWHRAGKRHNRQTAINDFIGAAEWLSASGYAAREKIAIGGGSNGGLLVGAALTQRPDLYRVVICAGPLLDMLRYHLFDRAYGWVDEYGCSENVEDFQHLCAYSPYHLVSDATGYPSVMFVSGDADTCCNPMHARKMAARLQAASISGNPILLDYRDTWGHVSVQCLSRRIDAITDRLVFIFHELSISA